MAQWLFLIARAGWEPPRFAEWLCAQRSRCPAELTSGPGRCRLHVCPSPPPALPGFANDEADVGAASAGYSGALLLDGAGEGGWRRAASWLRDGIGACHAYHATPAVVKDDCDATSRAADGITYLRPIAFHADIAASAGRRSWALHAPLAVRTHVGACRYVQWRVDERLSADGPAIDGVVELRFPTDDDLGGQFFASERAREDIARDTGHFIAGGPRLYTREHELNRSGRTSAPGVLSAVRRP